MQEDERQQVIDRNLPHLVCVLLGTPIDDKKNGNDQVLVDPAIFHKCLAYARCHIADPNVVDCDPDEVWDTLNHFLLRFCIENLSEFGDTFNQLANVVLNHPICMNHKERNIHWRLLDFVLSVNYKAFVSIRRNLPEMEQKRRNILEALKMTTESSQVDPKVTNNTKSISNSESVRVTHKKMQKPQSPRKKLTPEQIQRLCDEIRDLTSLKHSSSKTLRPEIPMEPSKPQIPMEPSKPQIPMEPSKPQIRMEPSKPQIPMEPSKPQIPMVPSKPLDTSDYNYSMELGKVAVKENFNIKGAKMELELNVIQNKPSAKKPALVDFFKNGNDMLYRIQTNWWQVDISVYNQPQILASNFSQGYADILIFQLRESQASIRKISEEHQLLSELIVLFFASVNCRSFKILNDNWKFRADAPLTCALKQLKESPHLGEIISSLKQMRHLRELIETYAVKGIRCDRMKTLTCFSVALRQLLRPVIEFLVHFERRLTRGLETATLQHFIETSRGHLEKIKLLYELSQNKNQVLHSMKSLRTLDTLFTTSSQKTEPKLLRSLSASVLLHTVRAYCKFLDSWWSTGDFADCHKEFPFEKIVNDEQTEYVLRKLLIQTELENCELFRIIQRHVLESSDAVAILCDSRTISDFNTLHGIEPGIPLHNSLIDAVIRELAPYQIHSIEASHYVPDILQQLQSSDHDAIRRLFYSFHMETRPDPRKPAGHSINELLRNFLTCADYTPITEILSQELQRLLNRRTRLVNSYISGLLQEFQGYKVVRHLRSVFLLWSYDHFQSEFELFFEFLRRNQLVEATDKLKHIVVFQDYTLGHMFQVRLTEAHPEFIFLRVRNDSLLNCIISQKQIEMMNSCFRLLLNLNFWHYRITHLPPFHYCKYERLLKALRSIQISLISALEEQLSHPCKLFRKVQELDSYNSELDEFTSLTQLRRNQELFGLHIQKYLLEEQFACSLPEILTLSKVFCLRWETSRALIDEYCNQKATSTFEQKYKLLRLNYLLETVKKCKAIGCLLGHI
ncbi:uncharacterized protein LOC6736842 isoform X2 [Drosophila simulans]|uniref:Uncharacterized protein, isoform A n=1 Tax=Drosophila simulans TaxID=7240 RepID=A0A0J9RP36_DROSI|nr:uncharacterized protein LOC6736842 [Drosophila simulans]XP_044778729.1 uncharacterized protein LOC6736842 isoform X2 [Drosophila simulans]KMY97696.1 uncharacterized protein Dsimw501_GD13219, isoform A [Drosophila simulans]